MGKYETNISNSITKQLSCNIWEKTFRTKSSLNVHKRIHSGEKPYKCDVCSISFTQKCTLTRHMLVHSGKKDFQCHVCGKYFGRKGDLKTHLITHTFNAQQFKCNICVFTLNF